MRITLALLAIIIGINGFGQQQDNATTLHVMSACGISKLYLNDKLITNIPEWHNVDYEIKSKGVVSVSILCGTNRYDGIISIGNDADYYYVGGGLNFKLKGEKMTNREVNDAQFTALLVKKTRWLAGFEKHVVLNFEEDINHPIGKIPVDSDVVAKQGTGFLLNREGYVLTNFHVIDGASKVKVKGINGDFSVEFEAEVVQTDYLLDLALLKVTSSLVQFSEPPYALIASEHVRQGEEAIALGYPIKSVMGKEVKVTNGIINSKSGYKGSLSMYQFSAAIQPGNSGGPLLNDRGDVLGVVTATLRSDKTESVGYAIKADYIKFFLEQGGVEEGASESATDKIEIADVVEKISDFVFVIETE